jgi:hypothetical protein
MFDALHPNVKKCLEEKICTRKAGVMPQKMVLYNGRHYCEICKDFLTISERYRLEWKQDGGRCQSEFI